MDFILLWYQQGFIKYHRNQGYGAFFKFIKIKLSCLGSHSPDSLRGQIFLYVIWGIVFDEVTGVGESNDGVGDVLTEDHYNVPRVSDQATQHGVGDLLNLR